MKRIASPYDCFRVPLLPILVTMMSAFLLVTSAPMQAQEQAPLSITVNSASAGSYSFSHFRYRILPANTQSGKAALAADVLGTPAEATPKSTEKRSGEFTSSISAVPAPGFYPEDLVYFGGAVLTYTKSHNIYVNVSSCGSVMLCWGDPAGFLNDLGKSTFIHVTDQYTGTAGSYGVGRAVLANQALFTNTISESQIIGLVHTAVKKLGVLNGYRHIYHVFLPAGVDTCFDQTNICYSPDNPSTFYFCAYHGSVDFSDIGHVLLSVEPYQNVPGCQAAPPNPNGQLADSTNSVLSHELIEAITDPDPGSGWVSFNSLLAAGAEIGDLCEPLGNSSYQFLDSYVSLNGKPYELQLEYSNKYHACAATP